jgi:hypothetical protein
MRLMTIVATVPILGALLAPPVAAQAPSMERCQQLLTAFDRLYSKKADGDGSSGSRLERDVGEAQCVRGNYSEGIRQIEAVMRRNQIPIPPG